MHGAPLCVDKRNMRYKRGYQLTAARLLEGQQNQLLLLCCCCCCRIGHKGIELSRQTDGWILDYKLDMRAIQLGLKAELAGCVRERERERVGRSVWAACEYHLSTQQQQQIQMKKESHLSNPKLIMSLPAEAKAAEDGQGAWWVSWTISAWVKAACRWH